MTFKAGDYTGATEYSRFRPDYCPSVLPALLGLADKPAGDVDLADVRTGNGIRTRLPNQRGTASYLTPASPARRND